MSASRIATLSHLIAFTLLTASSFTFGQAPPAPAKASQKSDSASPQSAADPSQFKAPHPHNIVIITIDTLRADRLGCYGYSRPTSPKLDKFAKQSVLFKNAHSTSSFTPPAHASIFTSEYVGRHGLLTWNPLPDDRLTLAEIFKAHGYRTAASVNMSLLSQQNLGQGFDQKHEQKVDKPDELRDARVIVNDGLDVIREESPKPFFLWLHLYDVHSPYGRQANWTRRFNPNGRAGVGDGRQYNMFPAQVKERGLSEDDLKFIADRYDAGIAYVDSQLGPLLDELSTPQRLKDTMVVITADHGENLLEHRERIFSHDPFLYRVVTHIPLIIRYPAAAGAGTVRDALVSQIDIGPTVAETTGIPIPSTFQGASLVPLTAAAAWPRAEIFMEAWGWKNQNQKAARSGNKLVIHDLNTSKSQFFDLLKDAAEMSPLATAPDESAGKLFDTLKAFMQASAAAESAPELDAETLRMLKATGYIGESDSARPTSRPATRPAARSAGESKPGTTPNPSKVGD